MLKKLIELVSTDLRLPDAKLASDLKARKLAIIEANKQILIEHLLDNPVFMQVATRGINIPPVIAARNVVEAWKEADCLDELYVPVNMGAFE